MRLLLTCVLIAATASAAAAAPKAAVAVNDETVTKAIAGAVKYLYGVAREAVEREPDRGRLLRLAGIRTGARRWPAPARCCSQTTSPSSRVSRRRRSGLS